MLSPISEWKTRTMQILAPFPFSFSSFSFPLAPNSTPPLVTLYLTRIATTDFLVQPCYYCKLLHTCKAESQSSQPPSIQAANDIRSLSQMTGPCQLYQARHFCRVSYYSQFWPRNAHPVPRLTLASRASSCFLLSGSPSVFGSSSYLLPMPHYSACSHRLRCTQQPAYSYTNRGIIVTRLFLVRERIPSGRCGVFADLLAWSHRAMQPKNSVHGRLSTLVTPHI